MNEPGSIKASHFALVTLTSVILLCATFLVVSFRKELGAWRANSRAAAAEKTEKRAWDDLLAQAANLSFDEETRVELGAKLGTVSITDGPLANPDFLTLGAELPKPLPDWCKPLTGDFRDRVQASYAEYGYDGFIICSPVPSLITDIPHTSSIVIFLSGGETSRIRFNVEPPGFSEENTDFKLCIREYVALSSMLAEKYGLPETETFDVSAGYEDDVETAWINDRLSAHRVFKANDGEINIVLRSSNIFIMYSTPAG